MIKYIYGLTRGYRGSIAFSATAGITRVFTGLIFIALSKRAVDIATGNTDGNLKICVIGLVCAIALELLCSALGNRTNDLSEAKMKNFLQAGLFSKIMNSAWTGQEKYHSGDVMSRITEDARVAAECLCKTVPTIIIAVVQLIGAFIFLWYFSPILAIVLAVILPLFIFSGRAFFKKMRILTRRIRDIESRLQEKMQESFQHRILLMTCRQVDRTIRSISALHHSRMSTIIHRANLTMYSRTAVIAGFESGYLTAFIWGVIGLYTGTVTFGMMTAYLQLAGQIQRPLAELARLFPGLIHSHTAFSRIAEIENLQTENSGSLCETSKNNLPLGISFNDVTFRYPDSKKDILNHFSYTFKPGSKTAIIGETGAGKSTVLRLILALLKPDQGEVNIFSNNGDMCKYLRVSNLTRKEIIYVPQGNSLLSGTIRHNLKIGKPDATEEEMRQALHDAAADFVFDLKFGLETTCGERGNGLSEGQAQRIAIARGLLSPGKILLLDEISASLDEDTEKLLMQRISKRIYTQTILIVTHRTGVIPYCDNILRIDKIK